VKVLDGSPVPLGATWDGKGVNFALYSREAVRVDVCLYDAETGKETGRATLPQRTYHVWHGHIRGLAPGQLYGFRVHGPYVPRQGRRFNPGKLLIDPYARAIAGRVDWSQPVFGYRFDRRSADLTFDGRDSAAGVPKSVVVDPRFDWSGDRRLCIPLSQTVIYEAHVKGMTARHPDVPEKLRGTYAGLATPPILEHLKKLGVTAIELLPVHHFVQDKALLDRGLRNYWGYNSIGYFAPECSYSSAGERGEQVAEFKAMVKAFHAEGVEVILDVVYNHTAEGNHLGPTISLRGVDNRTYYNLVPDNARYYLDFTGTGNTLNVSHPQALKLIADSLRYWVEEMHVDGFRFDLASTLAREPHGYDTGAGFFDIVHQDPVLSQVKLIAEPWDVGDFGYQVGNFPVLWSEWNGKYRDSVRRFWKGDEGQVPELASRLSGSSDLYQAGGRQPTASINFITAHDGFTLRDLVSYNDKHNEANGENNQDGMNSNDSWNCGAEGPTDDQGIRELRARQQRNLLATLFFSQGIPMLLGGDEIGRTQNGNNNAYCQDNEISWLDWNLDDERRSLLEFVARLIALRHQYPELRSQTFFSGAVPAGHTIKDITWIQLDSTEMLAEDWANPLARSLGVRLRRVVNESADSDSEPTTLLLLFNAHHEDLPFVLPEADADAVNWEVLLDTREPVPPAEAKTFEVGDEFPLGSRSVALFRAV
jgi:isoamylase